ncbi:MAG TPA: hypothetical protein VF529_14720 [Solirubrobacteraceae bacterium]
MRHGRPLLAALVAALGTLPAAPAGAAPPDLAPGAPSAVRDGPRLAVGATARNVGDGPLLVDASRPDAERPRMRADQLVEGDGRGYAVRRGVGTLRFGGGRDEARRGVRAARSDDLWRLRRFARFELRRASDDAVVRSTSAAAACTGSRCSLPGLLALRFAVGTTGLRGSLDVAGLPRGHYRLVVRLNPGVALLESDYANNSASTAVRLGAARARAAAASGTPGKTPGATKGRPPGDSSSEPPQASTSPGGTEPASGTPTTGPGAPASEAEAEPACDERSAARTAVGALRRMGFVRPLLTREARAFGIRVAPCRAATVMLTVALADGTVLWRARRELRTARAATLRLRLTAAGRRLIAREARRPGSRRVRLRLRARIAAAGQAPASSSASTSASTS